MDARYPHMTVKQIYLNGELIPNAAAADSASGWVDVIQMIDGDIVRDSTGRPCLVRHYGEVQSYTIEDEQMEIMTAFVLA